MSKKAVLLILAAIALLFAGCGDEKGFIDFTRHAAAPAAPAAERPLVIAFAPVMSPEETRRPYERMTAYLAEKLGRPVTMVQKRGAAELDLKALAKAAASKKAEMVHLKEVLALTGYQRGGCSPLGAKKEYPVFLDASAKTWDKIAVSAGRRGEQIVLAPADLERAVHATTAQLTR